MIFSEEEYQFELEDVVDRFKLELSKINTGKPSLSLFDNIKITAYQTTMPLSGVATIVLDPTDPQSILFRVFDKVNIPVVKEALEKAKFNAEIQQNDSQIRLKFRPLTEEDRSAKTKLLPSVQERFLVMARELRREYNSKVESAEKAPEDEVKRALEKIQEILKSYEEKIQELSKSKKDELMNI